jgi:hypothetical protein
VIAGEEGLHPLRTILALHKALAKGRRQKV